MKRYGLLLLMFWVCLPVQAHPHSWISMKTKIVGSDGYITKLSMAWQMDPMTSAYALDGENVSPAKIKKNLDALAYEAVSNMYQQHYLTQMLVGNKSIDFVKTSKGHYRLDGAKLTLMFDLTLQHPIPLSSSDIRLQVYEPTYYVDMEWQKASDVSLSEQLAKQCKTTLVQPHPTAKQISYAASIPIDVTGDPDLGNLFAQTIKLDCH
ncbi:DUF1007 family protein [Vibrio sp. S11_S32]|uniref:DUF1007 family protein n=1 Tax=Vibrio sp. S11_S32 TaxID=2720225 RepID=UPI001681523E|nr:DUF1007 family protein [Vibrio sp. S11_S32]MBD1575216.1 DUF1007 family protein [Vibrio sp. S11_S32]